MKAKLLPHEVALVACGELKDITHKGAAATWLSAPSSTILPNTLPSTGDGGASRGQTAAPPLTNNRIYTIIRTATFAVFGCQRGGVRWGWGGEASVRVRCNLLPLPATTSLAKTRRYCCTSPTRSRCADDVRQYRLGAVRLVYISC